MQDEREGRRRGSAALTSIGRRRAEEVGKLLVIQLSTLEDTPVMWTSSNEMEDAQRLVGLAIQLGC